MMKVLKGYVRSMAQPKRSMVKSYVLEKTLRFVIKYLQEFQYVTRRVWDRRRYIIKNYLTILCNLAHNYVITNTNVMTLWI